jgi:hypothetical protein
MKLLNLKSKLLIFRKYGFGEIQYGSLCYKPTSHNPQQYIFEAPMGTSWFSSNLHHELLRVLVIIWYSEPLIFPIMTDDILITAIAGTNTQLYVSEQP